MCLAAGGTLFITFRALSVDVTIRKRQQYAIRLLRDMLTRRLDLVKLGQKKSVKLNWSK